MIIVSERMNHLFRHGLLICGWIPFSGNRLPLLLIFILFCNAGHSHIQFRDLFIKKGHVYPKKKLGRMTD